MFQSNLNVVVQLKLSAKLKLFSLYVYLSKQLVFTEIMLNINEVVGAYSYFVN